MIVLTNEYHKAPMARAVPGAHWDPEQKAYVVDQPDPRAAAIILKLFPMTGVQHPELVELRNELLFDVRPFDNATPFGRRISAPRVEARLHEQWSCTVDECREKADSKAQPPCPAHGDTMKHWKFHDYQSIDLGYAEAFIRAHGGFYIGWDRGLGKTLALCCMIDALDAQRTLVVCPNTAKQDPWAIGLETFCPWVETIVMPNDRAKRERTLDYVRERCSPYDERGPFALVLHYEALALVAGISYKRKGKAVEYGFEPGQWPEEMKPSLSVPARNALLKAAAKPEHQLDPEIVSKAYRKVMGNGWDRYSFDLFGADEAHRLANPAAQQSKAAKKVRAKYRLAESGSIIQNHLEEMFSPLQWLFPDNYSSQWRDWNDRYLDYAEGGYGKICLGVKPERVEALRKELATFMVYRRKEDELDLPARIDIDERVEMSPSQRKVYDKLVQTCIARLDDGTVIAADEGAAMLTKLRQVATGLDLLAAGVADSSKLDKAIELIEDSPDDDFVVFSWYKAAVHALADRFAKKKIDAFTVTGDVPHARRYERIARFMAGEGRVFIGTIATLGESVNLQRANQVIMLDRSYNPALNGQAVDRAHRQGQRRRVTVTNLITKDSVDELNVLPALANKEALRAAILGGI